MDDFPELLARDFGYKPQGKSAPMAPPRTGSAQTRPLHSKSGPLFDDHDSSDTLLFNDVFGGPPKYSESASSPSFDYDSIFKDKNNAKTTSLPTHDKPVYDDDIFDGLPGIKNASSSSSHSTRFDDVFNKSSGNTNASPFDDLKSASFGGKFDNVFASVGTARERRSESASAFDDLLGNLGRKESPKRESESPVFDDLLGGFGRSSSPSIGRSTSESNQSRKPPSTSAKTTSSVSDNPFVVLESTSTPPATSTGVFTDPLDEISRFSSSGSTKVNNSSANRGVFQDLDPLDSLGKSVPPVSPEANKKGKDRSPSRSKPSVAGSYAPSSGEPVDKYPVENAEDFSQKKRPVDDFQDDNLFDMPAASTEFRGSGRHTFSPPPYESASPNETISSPGSEDVTESSDDAWLTVSEIPLFTQLTSAPPPSRPPPPRPPRISKSSNNSRKKMNEYSSYSNFNHYPQSPRSAHARSTAPSPIDDLEDFAVGRTQNSVNEHADFFSGAEEETNSSAAAASAAAMKDAMDKAEAKFRQMREREHLKSSRSRDSWQLDRDMHDAQLREARERQERLDHARLQREREEEERESRRLEKEREREREREENEREQRRLEREKERARELERNRGRQAVERATREARERAAADARLKAERAAVEKVQAEARERAERVAVQRAQAEARERAAADAKERAERAAAEARERANAEAREKVEARARAERAAVERAAAEARERAAADARERAAAAARANQQKNENSQRNNDNDLESFFSSRASSAPRPRANTSADPFFDTQNKAAPETNRRTSVGATSSMKKVSSTTNIVDDLSSIFGAPGSSGEFQEVEGETDERRRARLERHQRTQERAAKALAEKNQRDLQAQREQAERHRIAETLDAEIKRWAAGKEGNLRALLSTLQYVLWPECGWQPVSLTDLIIAAAVKKVYRKATLCIHPDKVQQKGANLQQKYVAEKVFDLLKEAWNKFNSEELF